LNKLISTSEIYKDKNLLVFVIDNEVVQTFLCDITGKDIFENGPRIGWTYDGEDFFPPQPQFN
jgi:hypothetical protein